MLFAPRFFGYEEEIRRKLLALGAFVDFHDQRPSNTFLTKALIRINKRFLAKKIDSYYAEIIDNSSATLYDFILFISPEAITKDSFVKLKEAHPESRFILYMWDSFRNKRSNIDDILPLFDERFSFDKKDCASSKLSIGYRPLFFLNEYGSINENLAPKIELLFIGTIHSDRHRILVKIKEFCHRNRLSYFYYMFLPSHLLFYYRSLRDSTIRRAGKSAFQYHALKKNEVIALMTESNVILDIEHPKQSGLTMRTIEVLGARRKLITTNEEIINYDFYHPQNILLIDRNNISIDPEFFKTPVVKLDPGIYNKYSIDGWISDIFRIRNTRKQEIVA